MEQTSYTGEIIQSKCYDCDMLPSTTGWQQDVINEWGLLNETTEEHCKAGAPLYPCLSFLGMQKFYCVVVHIISTFLATVEKVFVNQ